METGNPLAVEENHLNMDMFPGDSPGIAEDVLTEFPFKTYCDLQFFLGKVECPYRC
jgi:hypothetical protein